MRTTHLPTLGPLSFLALSAAAAQQLDTNKQNTSYGTLGVSEDLFKWKHPCPQLGALFPRKDASLSDMDEYLNTPEFFRSSVTRLSGAIQINTTSNDDMQDLPGHDPAWDHMFGFGAYLEETFPLVHQRLTLERINTHGLVYTWHGKRQYLKPTLLLAHQDVVPVLPESEDS